MSTNEQTRHTMLSVVMATHNGASTLPLTLNALANVKIPSGGAELIIVDNASTDSTKHIIQNISLPITVTYIFECRKGKSYALNRAIDFIKGDLIVFADDDVIPSEYWLLEYSAAENAYPDISLFSGQIRHFWQKEPPRWLKKLAEDGKAYAGTPLSRQGGLIDYHQVKGPNFAVRHSVLKHVHFRSEFSYGADGELVPGEDTQFARDAAESGYLIQFLPRACVKHIVKPNQVKIRSVLTRYFRIGRGTERAHPLGSAQSTPNVFGYPRYLYRTLPSLLTSGLFRLVCLNTSGAMRNFMEISFQLGQVYERKMREKKVRNDLY